MSTVWPKCKSGAVGSKPAFTRMGLPVADDLGGALAQVGELLVNRRKRWHGLDYRSFEFQVSSFETVSSFWFQVSSHQGCTSSCRFGRNADLSHAACSCSESDICCRFSGLKPET